MATYTASGTVVPMATSRATLVARRFSSRVQLAHSPPIAMPGVSVPHLAHGWLGPNPLDHGAGEFGRRSTSPQVRCADLVLDDGCLESAAQPVARLELDFGCASIDDSRWAEVKRHYIALLIDHKQPECAETFFNSVSCKILHRTYFHNRCLFVRPAVSTVTSWARSAARSW